MATILTKESHHVATKEAFLSALEAADNIYAKFVGGGGVNKVHDRWKCRLE